MVLTRCLRMWIIIQKDNEQLNHTLPLVRGNLKRTWSGFKRMYGGDGSEPYYFSTPKARGHCLSGGGAWVSASILKAVSVSSSTGEVSGHAVGSDNPAVV